MNEERPKDNRREPGGLDPNSVKKSLENPPLGKDLSREQVLKAGETGGLAAQESAVAHKEADQEAEDER